MWASSVGQGNRHVRGCLWQGQSVAQVALRSAEECAEAWRHIRPYVESVQGDRRLLARLQGARTPPAPALLRSQAAALQR